MDWPKTFGSSPHTRGALCLAGERRHPGGIIPAYAGSTGDAVDGVGDEDGSSPHTRGAHQGPASQEQALRIIPAYAGSTRRIGRRAR